MKLSLARPYGLLLLVLVVALIATARLSAQIENPPTVPGAFASLTVHDLTVTGSCSGCAPTLQVFGGLVTAAGASATAPDTVDVSRTSTGLYVVDTSPAGGSDGCAVSVAVHDPGSGEYATVDNMAGGVFEVRTYDGADALADAAFSFVALCGVLGW